MHKSYNVYESLYVYILHNFTYYNLCLFQFMRGLLQNFQTPLQKFAI